MTALNRLDPSHRAVDTASVKTTFDLPDPLLRKAEALAAQQGRPLGDLVAEAIDEKLEHRVGGAMAARRTMEGRREAWERWKTRLEKLPDGTWLNPDGIEDESFFQSLEEIRRRPWVPREPFSVS
jgi:hypothetical protein